MGLGFGVASSLPKGKSVKSVLKAIAQAIPGALNDEVMKEVCAIHEGEEGVYAMLFPQCEPVEFVLFEGKILASTKTSTCGPGYHAEVIEVVNRIGQACGIHWDWDDEQGGDETGFATSGDFIELQESMAHDIKMISTHMSEATVEVDRNTPQCMCWGMNLPVPLGSWFAISPSGSWSQEWMKSLAASPEPERFAREYHVWWERQRNPTEWAKLAVMLMWSEIRWHPPADESEEKMMRLALLASERADQSVLRRAGVQDDDVAELRAMLEVGEDEPPVRPRPSGFGLFRGLVRCREGGPWTIDLPGYFYLEQDEEGGLNWWYDAVAVRLSLIELATEAPNREVIEEVLKEQGASQIKFSTEEHIESGHSMFPGEDGYQVLAGVKIVGVECAIVTITYEKPHEREAVAAWKSISHPPPQA